MAGTAVFRIVVSSACIKKATATSHGRKLFTPGREPGSSCGGVSTGSEATSLILSFCVHSSFAQVPAAWRALRLCLSTRLIVEALRYLDDLIPFLLPGLFESCARTVSADLISIRLITLFGPTSTTFCFT
jgi:hypothetical protein